MTEERCWSTIGVWGDVMPRCPLLEQVTHCRNCSIFIQAGRALLARECAELPVWNPAPSEVRKGQFYLCFRLHGEVLALSSRALEHAMELSTIHALPNRKRDALLGLVNVHGRLELCLSLASLINVPTDDSKPSRMLVLSQKGERYVVPVTAVMGLERFTLEHARASQGYVRSIERVKDQDVGILDEDRLFAALRGAVGR